MSALLELDDVSMVFDGLRALDGVSFQVEEGEILGLIGPNGSGKSTAFNVVTGVHKPTGGAIRFHGKDITGMPAHRVARLGIGRTFQVVRPFQHLTPRENVLTGAMFGRNGARSRRDAMGTAEAVLDQIGLTDKADASTTDLTVIERKWLEVGRVLAGGPSLILLDEFMAGIAASEVQATVEAVKQINRDGVTVIIVEHIVKAITAACRRVVVLDAGTKLADGAVEDVVRDPAVIAAYLGTGHAAR